MHACDVYVMQGAVYDTTLISTGLSAVSCVLTLAGGRHVCAASSEARA